MSGKELWADWISRHYTMSKNEAQEVIDLTEDEAAPWLMQPPVLMRSPALQWCRAEHERRLTEADRYKNRLMTASVWLERIQELVSNEEEGVEVCAKLRKMLADQIAVFTMVYTEQDDVATKAMLTELINGR